MNPYEELKISPGSSEEAIKRAFRTLAKKHHPDIGGDRHRFERIRTAYETLMDPAFRADHVERFDKGMVQEEEIDIGTKIEIVLAWSTENSKFNSTTINSFANRLAAGRSLTSKQITAVDNIIKGFRIPLGEWLDPMKRSQALELYFRNFS